MGIRRFCYKMIMDSIDSLNLPYDKIKMLELGNQTLLVEGIPFEIAKDYFQKLGMEHTSIDLNGQNNALKLDITILHTQFNNKFEVVTNIGFSEHVALNQYNCFKNIHNFCKKDGIMIHNVPVDYCSPTHGEFQYPLDFFYCLVEKCEYEWVIKPHIVNWEHIIKFPDNIVPYKNRDLLNCSYKKKNTKEFIEKSIFDNIPITKI